MINWEKELERIFDDPLLADVTAPKKRATSSDRLIAGFQQIQDFFVANDRLPEDRPDESKLYHMWQGILSDDKKINRCRPFDDHNILPPPVDQVGTRLIASAESKHELTEEEQLEAILNDPLLADIESGADLSLFDVPDFMRERLAARKEADYVGSRKPCEDFDKYEAGFKKIHEGLKSGKYQLVKFSVQHLKPGRYFVEDGTIGYLAAFEDEGVNRHGDRDGRTRVIYENGSESDVKYKTITKNLSVTGYSVVDTSDMTYDEFAEHFTLKDHDVESGTIYVLRSKSTRPEIAAIKDLYKIGFTVTSVESRIANAKNEPTYLCADVEVVATWKVYNVKSSTFEALIHKLFSSVQLQLTVDGHRPKEWFIVPFKIIEQAVVNIIKGYPMMYDRQLQQLVLLGNASDAVSETPTAPKPNPSGKKMKCLSIQQPWASLICCGAKDVENRSWKPNSNPGRILIHAGAKPRESKAVLEEYRQEYNLPPYPMGAIIGYADVVGFAQHHDSEWAQEGIQGAEWKWVLAHAKFFKEPIPCKGRLGLYDVDFIDPDNLPETL